MVGVTFGGCCADIFIWTQCSPPESIICIFTLLQVAVHMAEPRHVIQNTTSAPTLKYDCIVRMHHVSKM